ncbi:MAG: transposase [Salinivirgaceae bacterium]|nr:transposase [Salinivirgaceae bacterium]
MKNTPLEYDQFYHIYNRGTNSCNLFIETTNYEHFLRLYDKYISPIADTFAWVLMKNHFHLLVKIKPEEVISELNLQGFKNLEGLKRVNKQFSNLFNAYTKAFNKKYHRTGSLFEHPFHRIEVTHTNQLRYMVYYIHHNPVHHGFVESMLLYPWSSYLTILSPKETHLKRAQVLAWFNNPENFKTFHYNPKILDDFKKLHID